MSDYITAKEAALILEVTNVRSIQRYREKYNITTKDAGAGKPKLYLKADIERCKKEKAKNDKHTPKKVKEKSLEITEKKKEVIEERIKKNEETKTETKHDLQQEQFSPLNDLGQTEFLRVEKLLIKNGTLHDVDTSLVLAYALSYQNYIESIYQSNRNDNTTTDDFGNLKVHPYFTIADKCLTQMTKLSNMLGISTKARIGLEIKKEKTGSMSDILNRRKK
jgi:P27 family predicted phage terminase small subunit